MRVSKDSMGFRLHDDALSMKLRDLPAPIRPRMFQIWLAAGLEKIGESNPYDFLSLMQPAWSASPDNTKSLRVEIKTSDVVGLDKLIQRMGDMRPAEMRMLIRGIAMLGLSENSESARGDKDLGSGNAPQILPSDVPLTNGREVVPTTNSQKKTPPPEPEMPAQSKAVDLPLLGDTSSGMMM